LLSLLGKGGSHGFQEILSLAGRPGNPQAILALARIAVDRDGRSAGLYRHRERKLQSRNGIGLFTGIFALLTLIPTIIVYVKRFHDRDKSGWWVLIGLIPIIGVIWLLIELGFLKGTPGPNRFGTD
jgi:uncharacterized membrane protein YhaH (DUF805 family)